ncbi:MAG: cell division protein FtsZ [Candidatus Colwellbacteria bacterium]|jgi:cell division protein FtsZ|nr:cell division protein FtsZ [Candidatus Colwellbacteria bacterium]MCK9497733.1 cell division protein FtsZ [Candidatus Colwellbacteria bacterium]
MATKKNKTTKKKTSARSGAKKTKAVVKKKSVKKTAPSQTKKVAKKTSSRVKKPIAVKKNKTIRKKRTSARKTSAPIERRMYMPNREISTVPVVKIKVVGIGGCGNNAVSRMNSDLPRGVEFIALNTDIQDLEKTYVKKKINIGRNLTKGMGAGMNPDIGRQSAEESRAEIIEALQGADLIFLTAGMGGGTGTGATPIVAEAAREVGALTVAVVTKPFAFEGSQRTKIADEGVEKLRDKVDSLIVIPNDRIFSIIGNDTPINKAFLKIDEVLKNTVQGVSEIISSSGLVNVDFADIKAIMQGTGVAIVGVGQASGADRAIKAATQAINSPLLERSIEGARGVLFGISGGVDLKMTEINEAAKIITENVESSAKIIFGAYYDRKVPKGRLKVNLIATGFNGYGDVIRKREKEVTLFAPAVSKPENKKEDENQKKAKDIIAEEIDNSGEKEEKKIDNLFTSGEIYKEVNEDGVSDDEGKNDMWDIPAFLRRKKKK